MSNGELVSWQAGVDWGRAEFTKTAYASASTRKLRAELDPVAADALRQMGRDLFGYWFMVGLADYGQTVES